MPDGQQYGDPKNQNRAQQSRILWGHVEHLGTFRFSSQNINCFIGSCILAPDTQSQTPTSQTGHIAKKKPPHVPANRICPDPQFKVGTAGTGHVIQSAAKQRLETISHSWAVPCGLEVGSTKFGSVSNTAEVVRSLIQQFDRTD